MTMNQINLLAQKYDWLSSGYVKAIIRICTGIVIFIYLLWSTRVVPILVMPAVMVLAFRCLNPKADSRQLIITTAASSYLGFMVANFMFRPQNLQALDRYMNITSPDTPSPIFWWFVRHMPFSISTVNQIEGLVLATLLACIAGLLAFAVCFGEKKWAPLKQLTPYVLLALLVVSLIAGATADTDDIMNRLSTNPKPESFFVDHFIYLKTFYNMAAGQGYYAALTEAALDDSRVNKLDDWISGYSMVKMPTVAYIWKTFAGKSGANIFYLSLLLATVTLVLVFLGLWRTADAGVAAFGGILLAQYLYAGASWFNILLPDWWAALFGLMCISLFFLRHYNSSAVLGLLAAASREPMVLLLAAAILAGALVKKRALWLPFLLALIAFFIYYGLHLREAQSFITGTGQSGLLTFFGLQLTSLLQTSNYLMFPFSMLGINILLAPAAIATAFMQRDFANRILVAGVLAGFLVFLIVMRPSSYWGQLYMPVVLISLAFVLRRADLHTASGSAYAIKELDSQSPGTDSAASLAMD